MSPLRWAIGLAVMLVGFALLLGPHATPELTAAGADTTGTVTLHGPGNLAITGRYRITSRTTWTIDVTGGRGHLAGITLMPSDFSGRLSSTNGVISGGVRVNLSRLPSIVSTWQQTTTLALRYGGRPSSQPLVVNASTTSVFATLTARWSGSVSMQATRDGSSFSLTGPLQPNGSFRLTGAGAVQFGTVPVNMTGFYESKGFGRRTQAAWRLSGVGGATTLPSNVSVTASALAITDVDRAVAGGAEIRPIGGSPVVMQTSVRFFDRRNWTLVAQSSVPASWQPTAVAGLTVNTGGFTGQISSSTAGGVTWNLRTSMQFEHEDVLLGGTFRATGPAQWSLDFLRASGSILGMKSAVPLSDVSGTVSFDEGRVAGSIELHATSTLLMNLPAGWSPETRLTIHLSKPAPADPLTRSMSVVYTVSNGRSHLELSGSFESSKAFQLSASGALFINDVAVPFGGEFESAGWPYNGVPRTEPYWRVSGDIEDAAGGRVPMSGGANLTSGTFGLNSLQRPPVETTAATTTVTSPVHKARGDNAVVAAYASGFSGLTQLQFSALDNWTKTVNLTYTDANNWFFSATVDAGSPWSPPGMTNLVIDRNAIYGSVTDTNGAYTWNLRVDSVSWTNVATGVNLTTPLTFSNTCPLASNCPPATSSQVFVGMPNGSLSFPAGVPTLTTTGAFLTDGTWARMNASAPTITFSPASITNGTLTMWKGPRGDAFDPNLDMPDLSSYNNGFGIEFCGNFKINVFDLKTLSTGGCIEWEPAGWVIGQLNTGGSITPGSSNGVSVNSAGLTGFAWTNLSIKPTISLADIPLTLPNGIPQLTANVQLPGALMYAMGKPKVDTTIPASGFYNGDTGDFALDGTVDVNMRNQGFTLKDISVHIGKSGSAYTLSLGADATVSVKGNHYPVSAYVGVDAGGGSSGIVVRLSVKGAVSAQPSGSFDQPTLLPTGNFEPGNSTLVDGTFDAKQPASVLANGDFENATVQDSSLSNSGFENGTTAELYPDGGFEDGSLGSYLSNGDFEDTDQSINGDFETNDWTGWTVRTGFTGTLQADSAPTAEAGTYVAAVKNNSASGAVNTSDALVQYVYGTSVANTTYTVGAWVKSGTASNTRVSLGIWQEQNNGVPAGCASGLHNNSYSSYFTVTTSWQYVSWSMTGLSCRTSVAIVTNVPDGQSTVLFDGITLTQAPGTSTGNVPISTTDRPTQLGNGATTAVYMNAANAHSGNGFASVKGTASNWWAGWLLGEAPVQGGNYTYSAWVRSPSGAAISGRLSIESVGGTYEHAYTAFTTSGSGWQRLSVTMQMAYSGHTDLQVTFYPMTTLNTDLYIDDVVVQQVQTNAYPAVTSAFSQSAVGVTTDGSRSHTGSGNLELLNVASSTGGVAKAYYDMPIPVVGATYTVTAWAKNPSATAASAGLALFGRGGTAESASAVRSLTSSDGWVQLTASFTCAYSNHSSLALDLVNQTLGSTLLFDDVSVTAANVVLDPDPSDAWTTVNFEGNAPLTSSAGVSYTFDYGNPARSLRSDGNGDWWWFNSGTGSPGYANGDFDASIDVYWPGSTADIADFGFWQTGSSTSTTGYVFRTQNSTSSTNSGFYTVSSGTLARVSGDTDFPALPSQVWHRIRLKAVGSTVTATITRLDNETVEYTRTITLPSGNRAGVFGEKNDTIGAATGHRWDNFTGGDARILYTDNPANAHTGNGYVQLVSSNNTGSMRKSSVFPVSAGGTYSVSAWVKAPSGTVTGSIVAATLGTAETSSTSFTANGTWQLVTASVPVTQAGATGITLSINNDSPNVVLFVDDVGISTVGLSQPNPFLTSPDTGGFVATAIYADRTKAHGGTNYFEMTAKTAGGSIWKDVPTTLVAGQQYTYQAWVRSPSGTPVNGLIGLWNWGGSPTDYRQVSFTATSTWQRVFLTLPVGTGNNTTMQPKIYITTTNVPLDVDDITITPVSTWANVEKGTAVAQVVVNDRSTAAGGSSYLRISGSSGGITAAVPTTISVGASYSIHAFVRSTTGASVSGQLVLRAAGGTAETVTVPFTATADWQDVGTTFTATKANTSFVPEIDLLSSGQLDIDEIDLHPLVVVQSDPWTATPGTGGTVSAFVYNDPANAHESNGLLRVTKTGSYDATVYHDITLTPATGSLYSFTAWVRSPSGTSVSGQLVLYANGGTQQSASASFTATGAWQQVTLLSPAMTSGHSSLRAQIVLKTSSVELNVDDALVQQASWQTFSDTGGTVTQSQINDTNLAQSGSGFLRIADTKASDGGVQLDTAGSVATGTTQVMTVWVRSADGSNVSGRAVLKARGSASGDDVATQTFVANGSWQKVTVKVAVTKTGQTSLRSLLYVDAANKSLDIDSVNIGQDPIGDPDGVTTPLPHPESGYAYLWDNAFGIPGAHLWSLTAQVSYVNGAPGLGVGATMYFDPSKASAIMHGTTWLKGDMSVNVSAAEPCFAFSFNSTDPNTYVQIKDGVFKTTNFLISSAPRGCSIGDYSLSPGSNFVFDTSLGNAPIHFELAIGRDDNGLPTFYEDLSISNLALNGINYNQLQMTVSASAAGSSVTMLGDFTLPMGNFYGTFTLSMNGSALHQAGDVVITDWKMVGGSFDVNSFKYSMSTDIPTDGSCSSFDASTTGNLVMGKKAYDFSGNMTINCGQLKVLHFDFLYSKSSVQYHFYLDYDSNTHVLAGGLGFKFERSTSWRFLGHRYRRHPKLAVRIDFSMDFDKPSQDSLSIYGSVSVSGGSGSLSCQFGASGDDSCSIYVHVDVFGGHTYRDTW